ncbi:MAG TPA: EAL domain-containing protein [Burkholderiaceae bacterium]|nr:EAL domain-containing protein [Burkholderiaceae bacterium]
MNRDLVVHAPETAARAAWGGLIEAMLDAVWLVDALTLRIVAANHAAGELMAMAPAELIGKDVLELAATPEDLCFWGEVAQGLADRIESDTLVTDANGATRAVTRRVACVRGDDTAALFVVVLHDRSAQLRTERELEGTCADLRATLESTHDGILVTDLAGRIRNFNRRFASLWQIPTELLERGEDDAVLEWMRRSVADPAAYMRRLAAIDGATMLQASDVLRLHSGTALERETLPQCLNGRPIGRVYAFRDITEKLEANRRIETLSFTDALTGLPNRRLLADRIEVALAQAKRDATPFALLFLNLDRFNHINETLGRGFGDRVLLDVADRISGCVREVDTVARLGGDEFVVLANQADARGAEATAWRVMEALKRPFTQGGMSFTVTASVGIALHPSDGASMDALMRRSDAAMREVKHAGRAAFRFHRTRPDGDDGQSRSRMRLDHAMRQALAQDRFRLHYQPQVDLNSGAVVGAEALIRWRDPELGEVSPVEFIPVAEESGFIVALGDWVLKRAVAQAAAWADAGLWVPVSVNVSALQFQQPGFVDGVATVLRDAGLAPQWLELELTESILVQDAQDAMLRLRALAELGVQLAIDDFGTGYSSLAYLKRVPVGRLKIDRSFVGGLPADESDAAIVRAIIQMGRALRLQIVAEGVENEAQRAFLQTAGCDLFQGFLYAPALAASAFEARVGRAGAGPAL